MAGHRRGGGCAVVSWRYVVTSAARNCDLPGWLRAVEHGIGDPAPSGKRVSAGPFSAVLCDSELRYLSFGGIELVRRLHMPVRDPGWGTVRSRLETLEVEAGPDGLAVRAVLSHHDSKVDFDADISIDADRDGVRYATRGRCNSAFDFNRIGICLMFPLAGFVGAKYHATGPDGVVEGILPDIIGPQRIVDGRILPLFPGFTELQVRMTTGAAVELIFEGDVFEMEDQRNWTDASYKIYSTPLALPLPHHATVGQIIEQKVRIAVAQGPS